MSIRKQGFALIFALLALWAASILWLALSVREQHLDADRELRRLFEAESMGHRTMAAFDKLSALGQKSMAMGGWHDPAEWRRDFDAWRVEFWNGLDSAEALLEAAHGVGRLPDLHATALLWERDLRESIGYGEGKIRPISFTLEGRIEELHTQLVEMFKLLRADMRVIVDEDRETLMELLARSGLIMAAAALIGGAVVILIMNRITHRVGVLERAMRRMAGGDLEVEVEGARRGDEIGRMAAALDVFRQTSLDARRLAEMNAAYERKLIEEKADARVLEASLEKEREINGLQRNFVAMVSHEFRTPLAIIDASVRRVMRAVSIDPDAMTKLSRTRAAVKRLTGLIESVLSLSTLDDGKITVKPTPCDLRQMLNEICSEQMEVRAGHQLQLQIDALPESVEADPSHLHQVFTNLLANAFKYSPDGGDVVVSGASETVDGELWARISIQDSGVGIPEEELPRLFARFFRARTSAGITGSGIGLHLVRALVDMHGGEISVASVEGEGSCFTVRLPAKHHGQGATDEIEPVAA